MSSLGSSGIRGGGVADFFGNQRFELEEQLGEGAFGVVYQAFDRVHETRVALKVMRRLGPDALFYFKKEFRALVDIQHPNLVRYHELFEDQGRWFLTMELVRGPSLVQYVREGHDAHGAKVRFDQVRLRKCLVQLACGVDALHRAGKVHRDVKPSNVRMADGRLVLLDFGLVLETDTRESARMPHVGTAVYMAPEQVLGADVGPLSDFYALGCVLYECLTGRHPFVGDPYAILAAKQTRDPERPSAIAPDVPLDLEELCMALLARDPAERASGVAVLNEMLPRESVELRLSHSAPMMVRAGFVGRARELSAVSRMIDGAEGAQLRVVLVIGESGVGKSALLAELTRRIQLTRPDAVVLSGRCYEREAVPFKAFDGVIDALARELRRLTPEHVDALLSLHAGLLPQVFPVLGRVNEIRERAPREIQKVDAPSLRRRAFAALKHLLAGLAVERLVVVVIDDVHWADADSASLLDELLSAPDAPGLVFIVASRPRPSSTAAYLDAKDDGDDPSFERVVGRLGGALRLRLLPLSESDARAMASGLLTQLDGNEAHAHAIAQESGGQPLFVAALAHYASARGGSEIPRLGEALAVSIDALSRSAGELLVLLAVAGAPLTWEVLSRAASVGPTALSSAIDEVRRTPWVRSQQDAGSLSLEFAHDRVRDLVLSRVSLEEQRRIHGALGDALARAGGDAESVVLHWIEAGQTDRVTLHAGRAAEVAVRSLAFARGVRLYQLALAHCPKGEVDARREVQLALSAALSSSGRAAEAAALYLELAQGASGESALEFRQRAAAEWLEAGEQARGIDESISMLRELGVELSPSRSRTRLLWSIQMRRAVTWFRGEREWTPNTVEMTVSDRVRVDLLFSLTLTLSVVDLLRSAELQSRHLEAASAFGDPYRLARALSMQAWFVRSAFEGRDLERSSELKRAKELAKLSRHPHALALVALVDALADYLAGRYREAARHAERAEQMLREECRGVSFELSNAQILGQLCRHDTGQWQSWRDRLPELLSDAKRRRDQASLNAFESRLLYWERLLCDEPDAARAHVESVSERVGPATFGMYAFNLLCAHTEIDLYVGDPNAHARVMRAWPAIERAHLLRARAIWPRAYSIRARAALGSAYLLPHLRKALLADAQRATEALASDKTERSHALAELFRSGIHDIANERELAMQRFGEAALACESCHMPQLAAAARRRQGMLLGGEEGRAIVVRAERWLREQGAVDPGRICAVLVGY